MGKGFVIFSVCFCKLGIFLSLQVNKKGKSSQSYLMNRLALGFCPWKP